MSNPSKQFECRWQPSRRLLEVYLCVQALALLTLFLVDLPAWLLLLALSACAAHAGWVLPRHILLRSPRAWRGLRCDAEGWQILRDDAGWQSVSLQPDSMALPWLVVLRFRLPGRRWTHSVCVPADAMPRDLHRRLRVRLKFSRQRWAVAE
ncbi:protein YgfX [Phytopseudomonas dryadis]|uniref:Toxin CptA n=1 Tax=Phytopseudomonas dryadis TaxID=2487520 RepID=A0A4Q9R509_9GAMM|nr:MULTISPECIES: protein YgfX [Pseudomonas]TBU95606.1 hypothetical protein DNK44_06685 [Pseudomonas dryadis]TBV01361.1 hypothetical protein DNK34_21220 [Pseudomonas dryadis]TBV14116.1 hypothetical protein DNK41_20815 [Pseudomonas sp. FRB 230]